MQTAVQQGWGGDESEEIAAWFPEAVLERFGAAERVYVETHAIMLLFPPPRCDVNKSAEHTA